MHLCLYKMFGATTESPIRYSYSPKSVNNALFYVELLAGDVCKATDT